MHFSERQAWEYSTTNCTYVASKDSEKINLKRCGNCGAISGFSSQPVAFTDMKIQLKWKENKNHLENYFQAIQSCFWYYYIIAPFPLFFLPTKSTQVSTLVVFQIYTFFFLCCYKHTYTHSLIITWIQLTQSV